MPPPEQSGDLVAAYYRLLQDPDPVIRERAARDWCSWEDAIVATDPAAPPNPRYDDPRFRMAFARIVTHYFHLTRGSKTVRSSATPTGCATYRACSYPAASISAAPSSLRGSCRERGPGANSSCPLPTEGRRSPDTCRRASQVRHPPLVRTEARIARPGAGVLHHSLQPSAPVVVVRRRLDHELSRRQTHVSAAAGSGGGAPGCLGSRRGPRA